MGPSGPEVGNFEGQVPRPARLGITGPRQRASGSRSWLVNHLVRRGEAVRAGQVVIPGSPVGLVPVVAGDRGIARFAPIGRVEAAFR